MATVKLDDEHFEVAVQRARELGKSTSGYIEFLIDAASNDFDKILSPVRDRFQKSDVTEDELDDAVNEARRAIARPNRRGPKK